METFRIYDISFMKKQKKINESEEKYRLIFENAKDAVFLANPKTGLIIDCNKAAAELLEKKKTEIIGHHQSQLHPKDKAKDYIKMFKKHFKEKGAIDDEAKIITKSGKIKPVHISASLIKIGGGLIMQGIFRDITEQKKVIEALEKSEQSQKTLLKNIPHKIFYKDLHSAYVLANEAFARDLGIKTEEIIDKTDFDFFPKRLAEKYRQDDKEIIKKGKPKELEEEYIHDENVDIVNTYKAPVKDINGKIIGIFGIFWDISKRKKAEEALRQSENKFRQFFENDPEYCYMISPDGKFVDINKSALKALGYKKFELIGQEIGMIYTPESQTKMKQLFRKWKRVGKLVNEEIIIQNKQGEKTTVLLSASNVKDKNGKILHSISVQKDINEIKIAEQKMRESEETLSLIFNGVSDAIVFLDTKGRIIKMNKALVRIGGYTEKDLLGKSLIELKMFPVKSLMKMISEFNQRIKKGKVTPPYEVEVNRKDGRKITLEIHSAPLMKEGKLVGVGSILRDVTIQKKAEEDLRASEERYRNLFESAPDALIVTDSAGHIVNCSLNSEAVYGYSKKEMAGKSITKFMVKESAQRFLRDFAKIKNLESIEGLQIVRKDGEILDIWRKAFPLKDERGEIAGLLMYDRDVTEFNDLMDTLSKEKEKIQTILESIGDGVLVTGPKGKIFMLNEVAEKLMGYTQAEVMGKKYDKFFKLIYEKEKKPVKGFFEKTISTGKIQVRPADMVLVSKSGLKIPISISASSIKGSVNKIIGSVMVFRDVTELRKIDKAKTEFVSLASHQLRSPLSTIRWYVDMLLKGSLGDYNEKQGIYLKQLQASNQRMIELVNSLLNVSRIELGTLPFEPEVVDLKKIIEAVLVEYNLDIKNKKLKLSKKYSADSLKIKSDSRLVRIVIENLIDNAVQYTPARGKIDIAVSRGKSKIEIIVGDSGYGIPQEEQGRIFEKLFRAKNIQDKNKQGTGLGLYIVRSILDYIGGEINFKSKQNKGSRFYVSLPIKKKKIEILTN